MHILVIQNHNQKPFHKVLYQRNCYFKIIRPIGVRRLLMVLEMIITIQEYIKKNGKGYER